MQSCIMSSSKDEFKNKTKKFDPVWKHFVRDSKNDSRAQCKYCPEMIRNRCDRAKNHLKSCANYLKVDQRKNDTPLSTIPNSASLPSSTITSENMSLSTQKIE